MDRDMMLLCRRLRKVIKSHAKVIHYPSNLGGLCAVTSFVLARLLNERGMSAKPVVGVVDGWMGHCWVEADGMVIDLTATQFTKFKRKPLLKFPVAEREKYGYKANIELSVDEFNSLDHWPLCQQPKETLVRSLIRSFEDARLDQRKSQRP